MSVSEPLFEGKRYSIVAWLDEEERSATHEFITSLAKKDDSDAALIIQLLSQTASHGPPQNEQKFRYLQGKGKGLVEFKARGGSRILAFIDQERRRIVCTHGIPKLKDKQFNREMEKAQDIKSLYLTETNVLDGGNYVN